MKRVGWIGCLGMLRPNIDPSHDFQSGMFNPGQQLFPWP
jgi:hypothetical protein